ncbi:MAG: RtcB family protein [Victivallales bacterium]|nr:RtcB family protein [Victivallales bacterium]
MMEWIKNGDATGGVPLQSWCEPIEPGALQQAINLTRHPAVFHHVALMPDCHVGYGMPIGGVIACADAVIPNAVGVDIGCGMAAVQTDLPVTAAADSDLIRNLLRAVKQRVPVGEGHSHRHEQDWSGFQNFAERFGVTEKELASGRLPWLDLRSWTLDRANLGSLGGGNHFMELQAGDDGRLWLMLHSGSRNLGARIAAWFHRRAIELDADMAVALPSRDLAFLPAAAELGRQYIQAMTYALEYARENRRRMMAVFKEEFTRIFPAAVFTAEVNIHHNYAALEEHFGREVWVHRKGATSARAGESGIIPGSMGTASYLVRGKGNPESFQSCSHGAGRRLGRRAACENLSVQQCDRAMEGVVFERWHHYRGHGDRHSHLLDLSEAPPAYKDIDRVIRAELDLIVPAVKLRPLGVIKG